MSIDIWFDGGSHNNQSTTLRQGYGSFVTFYNGKIVPMTIDKGNKDGRKLPRLTSIGVMQPTMRRSGKPSWLLCGTP
jgi:hypothetical protein